MPQRAHIPIWISSVLLVVGTGWPGCDSSPAPVLPAIEPVYILSAERLTPPPVGLEKSYRPDYILDIRADGLAPSQSVGFILKVAATQPEMLKARLRDTSIGVKTDLVKISPPDTSVPADTDAQLAALAEASSYLLAAGQPVFSVVSDTLNNDPAGGFRVAFLLPMDLLTATRTLECYVSSTPEGGSLAGDRINLVPDFFYLAVIGDSILWGNGLNHRDKFTTLAAERIEATTGKRVITQTWAITGARIVPSEEDGICGPYCFGEAPKARASITLQAELIEKPEMVDLIIMDGCINDIGIGTILDPETIAEDLIAMTQQYCGQEMAVLLENVRRRAPQAAIIVTGYFPIVSLQSDLFGIREFALVAGEQVDETDEEDIKAFIQAVSANSDIFYETSSASLAEAVAGVNAANPDSPPAIFVDPGFGPANAVFAPEKWLWSLTMSNTIMKELVGNVLKFFPEDSTLLTRIYVCLEEDVVDNAFQCLYASIGHPNPDGARAYARGVIDALGTIGILPLDE